ncbi:aminodeoxychorismate lyase [Malassezia psittaci]|uniref:Aminodeoxychorismate lyase n=1 Tax=Malassezia psittaci TaxID=1821823 RepID=A0AAF0FBE4_9BASI|nr:aminodeoxychorismate lyase [Malassezia psittaci]
MVQSFQDSVPFPYPWTACVQAFFLRYPNPQASHVLTVDVLDRRIEPRDSPTATGEPNFVLCTTRLLLKRGSLPKWAPKNIIKNSESWVLEESEVDLTSPSHDNRMPRTMSIWTRNLDHTTVLAVTEGIKFSERISSTSPHTQSSDCLMAADISSQISFRLLRNRIEKFGLKSYLSHKETSREGLLWSIKNLEYLREPSGTMAIAEVNPSRSRTRRLLHALRPPFLDGYPLGPIQWAKNRWRLWREKYSAT